MTTTRISEDKISRKWVVQSIRNSYWKLFLKYGLPGGFIAIAFLIFGMQLNWHSKVLNIICIFLGMPFIFYLSILLGSPFFFIPQKWQFTEDKIVAKGLREFGTIKRKNITSLDIQEIESLPGYTKIHIKSKEWFGFLENNFEIIVESNGVPREILDLSAQQ